MFKTVNADSIFHKSIFKLYYNEKETKGMVKSKCNILITFQMFPFIWPIYLITTSRLMESDDFFDDIVVCKLNE